MVDEHDHVTDLDSGAATCDSRQSLQSSSLLVPPLNATLLESPVLEASVVNLSQPDPIHNISVSKNHSDYPPSLANMPVESTASDKYRASFGANGPPALPLQEQHPKSMAPPGMQKSACNLPSSNDYQSLCNDVRLPIREQQPARSPKSMAPPGLQKSACNLPSSNDYQSLCNDVRLPIREQQPARSPKSMAPSGLQNAQFDLHKRNKAPTAKVNNNPPGLRKGPPPGFQLAQHTAVSQDSWSDQVTSLASRMFMRQRDPSHVRIQSTPGPPPLNVKRRQLSAM
jgi:hypothetical protein